MMDDPSLGLQPVAFFDDNSGRHSSLHGIPVVGTPERISEGKAKLRIEELIIAMPSAPARRIRQVWNSRMPQGWSARQCLPLASWQQVR